MAYASPYFQGLMSVYCLYSLIISDVGPFDARDKTVPWSFLVVSIKGPPGFFHIL